MSRKTRVRAAIITVILGAVFMFGFGAFVSITMPYLPYSGIVSFGFGCLFLLAIPSTIKAANRKADEEEMLAEWRKQRDKQQPRR